MARPLLYQPNQRWLIGVAFGTAALIHFGAIALASIHQKELANELPPGENSFPPIEVETQSSTDNPTPPPEVLDPPTQTPTDKPMFPEEGSTPVPIHRQTAKLAVPIVKTRSVTIGSLSLSSARISALTAPRTVYPYEARRQRITGNGVVIMTVDPVSGSVTDVVMETSTGSSVLDNAAVTGFRRWRFKPGTVSRVKSPVTFTMTGAQY
jgi:TonB family protein